MWYARLSRREFFELCLGSMKPLDGKLTVGSAIFTDSVPDIVTVYWAEEPSPVTLLPNLVVLPDAESNDLMSAVMASPQVPTPLTSLCRILTIQEAQGYFELQPLNLARDVLPVVVALTMVESVLHSGGRFQLRQLSPAICSRTLSFAWGRALAIRAPIKSVQDLPNRWLETYGAINSQDSVEVVRNTMLPTINALTLITEISAGILPSNSIGALAFAIVNDDQATKESAWAELAKTVEASSSLAVISTANREERGSLLQAALTELTSRLGQTNENAAAAACAFLATQVAPGSMEHFELLKGYQSAPLLVWYAMFSAMQAPKNILGSNGGLGLRIHRDLARAEDQLSKPDADISFGELKALDRISLEATSRRISHAGEIQVELIPYVTSNFAFHTKPRPRNDLSGAQMNIEESNNKTAPPPALGKARVASMLLELVKLVNELPDGTTELLKIPARKTRKK